MSMIRPFSSSEINSLRELLEKNGFKIHGLIDNYFRYSISTKDKLLIFSLKFPVKLPIRLSAPFEIVTFRVSLVFKLWNLNQKMNKGIISLIKMLLDLEDQVSIEHDFPMKGYENKLIELLRLILPEIIKNENERAWINRIRISLMNKSDKLEEFDNNKINSLVNTLEKIGLTPTFKQPWEIRKGLPKLRTSETLLFSNEENEFFILEKGFFTYFKDLEYNKFYVRSSFESYTPYILNELYKTHPDFNIQIYLENWIKFARMLLNSMIEIINVGGFDFNEFIDFRPEKEMDSEAFELDENNFPFSALHYESSVSKELYSLHIDLFNRPPASFEIIESLQEYTKAEELIKSFQFKEAAVILNNSLKIFNKYQQKKAVASILLQLRTIASRLNQKDLVLNYLLNALEVAKSGEIPISYILRIHYQLGKVYYKLKDYKKSINHFKILVTFLDNEKESIQKIDYIGMASLYLGLAFLEQQNVSESKTYIKRALNIGTNKSSKVKLKYYLLNAKLFKNKGNLSKAHKFLKLAIEDLRAIDSKQLSRLVDLFLELAELYIHYRKDTKKAFFYLESSEKYISKKKISDLQRALRWNLLMSDFYKILVKDNNESNRYLKQSKNVRNQLRVIGVVE